MASEGILQFSVASVVGDVLQQHGKKLHAIDLESRKANEDCKTKLSFFDNYVHILTHIADGDNDTLIRCMHLQLQTQKKKKTICALCMIHSCINMLHVFAICRFYDGVLQSLVLELAK